MQISCKWKPKKLRLLCAVIICCEKAYLPCKLLSIVLFTHKIAIWLFHHQVSSQYLEQQLLRVANWSFAKLFKGYLCRSRFWKHLGIITVTEILRFAWNNKSWSGRLHCFFNRKFIKKGKSQKKNSPIGLHEVPEEPHLKTH